MISGAYDYDVPGGLVDEVADPAACVNVPAEYAAQRASVTIPPTAVSHTESTSWPNYQNSGLPTSCAMGAPSE
jgi:hypothetical protein